MPFLARIAAALAVAVLPACAALPPPQAAARTEERAPVTILVSIDGFRPDYLKRGITPNLSALAAAGASGPMVPSFPSKTFPNHYTLVTGLRPDRNGIVGNRMEDPRRPGEVFTLATDDPFWWSGAEPIWVAAERAGIRTATMFWPGSNTGVGGLYPSDWWQFNQAITGRQRVDAIIDWMRRPAAMRPRFATLYFDTVDTAGHRFGPDAKETNTAIAEVDALIGRLHRELASLGQPANLVIVSDHGMAATPPDQVIRLDHLADPVSFRAIETGPYAAIQPQPGREPALAAALLKPHPHMQCWRKAAIPARFHYGANPRVPAFFCLAETGWSILDKVPAGDWYHGNHGYDNGAPEMEALFIARGPAFRSGVKLDAFDNTDVYPLLRRLLGLPQADGLDGSLAPLRPALAD